MKKLWVEKGVLSPEQLNIIQQRVDSYPAPHGLGRISRKIATLVVLLPSNGKTGLFCTPCLL